MIWISPILLFVVIPIIAFAIWVEQMVKGIKADPQSKRSEYAQMKLRECKTAKELADWHREFPNE